MAKLGSSWLVAHEDVVRVVAYEAVGLAIATVLLRNEVAFLTAIGWGITSGGLAAGAVSLVTTRLLAAKRTLDRLDGEQVL